MTSADGVLMTVGVVAGAGLAALLTLRRGRAFRVRLAGVGPISIVTQTVGGLALIGVGYHVFVHAAGLPQFRAPLPIAVGVAIAAIVGSVLVDAVENRSRPDHDAGTQDDPTDRSGR